MSLTVIKQQFTQMNRRPYKLDNKLHLVMCLVNKISVWNVLYKLGQTVSIQKPPWY